MTTTPEAGAPSAAELNRYLQTAVQAAHEAARIQLAERGTDMQIETKTTDTDLVTRVDRLCEERVREVIAAAHPSHQVLGEEGGAVAGAESDPRFRWIVDPIDGTVNYAHGYPMFCVSVALEVDGEVLVGVVYDGVRDELFSAVAGQGAHLNGRRIAVTTEADLQRALCCTGFAYEVEDRLRNLELFGRVLPAVQGVRRGGSAALDVCYVACGRLDAFWELTLRPWDMAASTLILREAGGSTSGANGAPHRLSDPVLVATNGHLHGKLLDLLGFVSLA
ncbi:MAG: inositol monophosphatase [Deinococcales bacterium]|nr:inositol monophosphatase [Deinococcales bacterium]